MNPVKIGITTREVSEVISFEFHPPSPGTAPAEARHPLLRAAFADGTFATTRGNEAVTLKVLLASLGVREVTAVNAGEDLPPALKNPPRIPGAIPPSSPASNLSSCS